MIIRLVFLTIFFISLVIPSFCFAEVQKIGILPYYKSETLLNYYRPFIRYLNKQTGITWELKLYPNYEEIVEAICSNEISVAYLGPIPFGLAYEKCKANPIVVNLGRDGKTFYRSVIFTSDHKIEHLKDLKGKKIGFGDRHSTSSYVLPRKMLEYEGIDFKEIIPIFFKDHDRIIESVINNEVLAGAVKELAIERYKSFNFKIIKKSGPIVNHTFCASKKLDPSVEDSFKKALLRLKPLKNKSDEKIVNRWDPEIRYGFVEPPKDYIDNVMMLLRLYKIYN